MTFYNLKVVAKSADICGGYIYSVIYLRDRFIMLHICTINNKV